MSKTKDADWVTFNDCNFMHMTTIRLFGRFHLKKKKTTEYANDYGSTSEETQQQYAFTSFAFLAFDVLKHSMCSA